MSTTAWLEHGARAVNVNHGVGEPFAQNEGVEGVMRSDVRLEWTLDDAVIDDAVLSLK